MPANLTISGYPFTCVPLADINFADVAAIYVILCVAEDGSWTVLDVGQSGEVGDRLDTHDRKRCWEQCCPNRNIWVCVHPTPSTKYTRQQRMQLESDLRRQLAPKCGKR